MSKVTSTKYPNIKIRDNYIQLDFRVNGIRCREKLNIPPTKKNLITANDLMGKIRYDLTFNSFRYTDYFPNSPRATLFGETKATTMNMQEAMEWWYDIEKKIGQQVIKNILHILLIDISFLI